MNFIISCFCFFIYFERARASGGGAERASQAGSALSVKSPTWGSISQTTKSWPELNSRVRCLTDRATRVPQYFLISDLGFIVVLGRELGLPKAILSRLDMEISTIALWGRCCVAVEVRWKSSLAFSQVYKTKDKEMVPSLFPPPHPWVHLACEESWL